MKRMTEQQECDLEHLVEDWCDAITHPGCVACCVFRRSDWSLASSVRLFAVGRDDYNVLLDRADFLRRHKEGTLREFIETIITQAIISGELVK